jgi:hypothetical protein
MSSLRNFVFITICHACNEVASEEKGEIGGGAILRATAGPTERRAALRSIAGNQYLCEG